MSIPMRSADKLRVFSSLSHSNVSSVLAGIISSDSDREADRKDREDCADAFQVRYVELRQIDTWKSVT